MLSRIKPIGSSGANNTPALQENPLYYTGADGVFPLQPAPVLPGAAPLAVLHNWLEYAAVGCWVCSHVPVCFLSVHDELFRHAACIQVYTAAAPWPSHLQL